MSSMNLDFVTDLSDDEVAAAQGTTRARGVYDQLLSAFLESGKRGIAVAPGTGPFAGKKAANIKNGIDNARKRLAEGHEGHSVKATIHTADNGTETVRIFRNEQAES